MKFSYDIIKYNLGIYNEAKSLFPIILEFENGNVSQNSMRNIGLERFADFRLFLNDIESKNFELIQALSFKELKEILIKNTDNKRFKTWLANKTEKSFKKLIQEDSRTFDRLLNGRWLSKPSYGQRRRWGRRSPECIEGFNRCLIPILNWGISNDIDFCDDFVNDIYNSFSSQEKYSSRIKWFTRTRLSLSLIPEKEIEVTHTLMRSIVEFIDKSDIDFRKLNSDFIIDSFSTKVKSLMSIPSGTSIRAKEEIKTLSGLSKITPGKDYLVESSSISSGFLKVMLIDDSGLREWYQYRYFEDKSIERDLLLTQLGII